jgi:hypothetical protein
MAAEEYEVGRKVWIHNGGKDNPLVEAEIVHKFKLDWGSMNYVLEIPTPVDPILVVRDWFSISEDGKTLNIWRKLKDMWEENASR